jgi:hypothetical protein
VKIAVVPFCTNSWYCSQKIHFCPFLELRKWKIFFEKNEMSLWKHCFYASIKLPNA